MWTVLSSTIHKWVNTNDDKNVWFHFFFFFHGLVVGFLFSCCRLRTTERVINSQTHAGVSLRLAALPHKKLRSTRLHSLFLWEHVDRSWLNLDLDETLKAYEFRLSPSQLSGISSDTSSVCFPLTLCLGCKWTGYALLCPKDPLPGLLSPWPGGQWELT